MSNIHGFDGPQHCMVDRDKQGRGQACTMGLGDEEEEEEDAHIYKQIKSSKHSLITYIQGQRTGWHMFKLVFKYTMDNVLVVSEW